MGSVRVLERAYQAYKGKAAFQIVYIREAHPGYYLNKYKVKVPNPLNLEERGQNAMSCVGTLNCTIPCVIDCMDNKVDTQYMGWPDRLYIVGKDGRIAYQGRRGPSGFSVHEMLNALNKMLGMDPLSRKDTAYRKKGGMWTATEGDAPPVPKKGEHLRQGQPAPDFSLQRLDQEATVTLSSFRGKKNVILIFGSYSWLPFYRALPEYQKLYQGTKGKHAFFFIYSREATPGYYFKDGDLRIPEDKTAADRRKNASLLISKTRIGMPCLLDSMDDSTVRAFGSWPAKIVVIDKNGKVAYLPRSRGRGGMAIDAKAECARIRKILGLPGGPGR